MPQDKTVVSLNENKTAKEIVAENFKGLVDLIKDEDMRLWYEGLVIGHQFIYEPALDKLLVLIENYCSTAFWAGFANGSLPLDMAMKIHNEWIENNITKPTTV